MGPEVGLARHVTVDILRALLRSERRFAVIRDTLDFKAR